MRHANRKAAHAREPNERTNPYVSWHCSETVTGAALQAAGQSSAGRPEVSSEGRRRRRALRTGLVRSDSDGKVHDVTSKNIRHSRYRALVSLRSGHSAGKSTGGD